jgi:hypothetical protein
MTRQKVPQRCKTASSSTLCMTDTFFVAFDSGSLEAAELINKLVQNSVIDSQNVGFRFFSCHGRL